MLYRLQKLLSFKPRSVKSGLVLPVTVGWMMFAPVTAFGLDVTTTEYKVRFERAAVQTVDGIESTYEKLRKKAKRACRIGRNVNDDGEEISKKDCASDLLEQFVESASIEALSEYHLGMTENEE
ncbi:UrcA family protein [Litorimonas sp.]|uniref:UrcA family protein n=1 Tax=Litorimonas sp. TaxID=1892381 RepID=UPI003A88CCD8